MKRACLKPRSRESADFCNRGRKTGVMSGPGRPPTAGAARPRTAGRADEAGAERESAAPGDERYGREKPRPDDSIEVRGLVVADAC